MSKRLFAHIPLDYRKFSPADRTKIISGGPSQRFVPRNPIAVGDPRACAFQSLHQPWNVECRGELEQHVHMVARHAKRDGASPVAVAFRWKEFAEEVADRRIDQRKTGPCRPCQVSKDAGGHARCLLMNAATPDDSGVTEPMRRGPKNRTASPVP